MKGSKEESRAMVESWMGWAPVLMNLDRRRDKIKK